MYRKWYGNNDYVVNWENDGYEIKTLQMRMVNYVLDHKEAISILKIL